MASPGRSNAASATNGISVPAIRSSGGSRNFGSILFIVLFSIGLIHSVGRSLNGYNKYFTTTSIPYQDSVSTGGAGLVTGNVMTNMVSENVVIISEEGLKDSTNSVETNSVEGEAKSENEEKEGTSVKTNVGEVEGSAESDTKTGLEPKQEDIDDNTVDKKVDIGNEHAQVVEDTAAETVISNVTVAEEGTSLNSTIDEGSPPEAGIPEMTTDKDAPQEEASEVKVKDPAELIAEESEKLEEEVSKQK